MNERYPKTRSPKLYITDTTREKPDWPTLPGTPIGLLDGGAGVLRQEGRGTRELVAANGARLPTDGTTSEKDRERCEAIGIKLGKAVEGDPLFREAELPAGWKITYSQEDSRTTLLIDANGNWRGYIWYKAASYDRSAYIRIETRYWPGNEYPSDGKTRTIVMDRVTKAPIWTSEYLESPRVNPKATAADWKAYEEVQLKQHADACSWLDKTYPEWENPAKYWP